jgi:hypothetical protein
LPNHHSGGLGFTRVYLPLVSPYLCPPGGRVAWLYPQALDSRSSRLLQHAQGTLGLFWIAATNPEASTVWRLECY